AVGSRMDAGGPDVLARPRVRVLGRLTRDPASSIGPDRSGRRTARGMPPMEVRRPQGNAHPDGQTVARFNSGDPDGRRGVPVLLVAVPWLPFFPSARLP